MTKPPKRAIVRIVKNKADQAGPGKERIMAAVDFAANGFAYYLHSEQYRALFGKEIEQSLVKIRSCKIRKRRKTV